MSMNKFMAGLLFVCAWLSGYLARVVGNYLYEGYLSKNYDWVSGDRAGFFFAFGLLVFCSILAGWLIGYFGTFRGDQ